MDAYHETLLYYTTCVCMRVHYCVLTNDCTDWNVISYLTNLSPYWSSVYMIILTHTSLHCCSSWASIHSTREPTWNNWFKGEKKMITYSVWMKTLIVVYMMMIFLTIFPFKHVYIVCLLSFSTMSFAPFDECKEW